MAVSTISSEINDGAGGSIANVRVVARLLPRPAFETATGIVLAATLEATSDAAGQYSFVLTETASITPSDSYYEIIEYVPDRYGGPVKHTIQVGAANTTVYASLVSAPPAPAVATYLTQTSADARYVQSPGSFGASGDLSTINPDDAASGGALSTYPRSDHQHAIATVIAGDSRPGDAASEGAATSFPRSDHVHDRETQRGTAAVLAALSGTDLIIGYPYVTSDATNITGTGIATPATTSQPARADSLFVRNTTRFQPGFWNQPWGVMGYVEVTANQNSITTVVDLTSLTLTFTAAANRRYRIQGQVTVSTTVGDGAFQLYITDSTPTTYNRATSYLDNTGALTVFVQAVETFSAGSQTVKLRLERATGTGTYTMSASSTAPAFLLIEDIGPNGAAA